jgi:hypothetical protein
VARLLSQDGDEICSLARLRIDARVFTAWIAPYLASHPALASAILETEEGRRYAVSIDSWELRREGSAEAGYVRGTIIVDAPNLRSPGPTR